MRITLAGSRLCTKTEDFTVVIQPLLDVVERTEIPISTFHPTHVASRGPQLLTTAITWIQQGGCAIYLVVLVYIFLFSEPSISLAWVALFACKVHGVRSFMDNVFIILCYYVGFF